MKVKVEKLKPDEIKKKRIFSWPISGEGGFALQLEV